MIKVSDFYKKIGNKILIENINMIIENKIYQLIGANGVGKSVFLRCLASIDTKFDGIIEYEESNRPILFLADRGIGIPFISVKDNIILASKILELPFPLEEYTDLFSSKIDSLEEIYEKVSTGIQAKVGLSLLFSEKHFRLIIIDETLNSVDQESREILYRQIRKIQKFYPTPIIIVSHTEKIKNYIPEVEILSF